MTRNPVLIISALVASLGPLVGNGLYAGPGSTGAAILAEAREGLPTIALLAYALELLGLAALSVLFAWLVVFVFQGAPVAALTTAIAGAAMLAVKAGSAVPMMTVYAAPDEVSTETAAALMSMNGQAFVVSGFLMSLAFLAAGIGLLSTEFPRWLCWWAAVAGALGVVAGMVGVVRPAAYVPIPFVLLLLWMVAVALTAVTRRTRDADRGIVAERAQHRVAAPE